jgi:hypothetical protein
MELPVFVINLLSEESIAFYSTITILPYVNDEHINMSCVGYTNVAQSIVVVCFGSILDRVRHRSK